MKTITVVAAIILKDGEVLLARRLPHKRYAALMWEFPGGKVEAGETHEDALVRELDEELGIDAKKASFTLWGEKSQVDKDVHIHLFFYLVQNIKGEPQGLEGQEVRFVNTKLIRTFPLVPNDTFLYEKIAAL